MSEAQQSLDIMDSRAQAWEILGYCFTRQGNEQLGLQSMRQAVDADPHNWRFHYSLALVQASAGQNPERQLEIVRRLNPLEQAPKDAVKALKGKTPEELRRRPPTLALPDD